MTAELQADVLAIETQTGRAWIPILLLALIGPAISLWWHRTTAVIWTAGVVGLVVLGASAMMWSGFQYRFLRHGIEIHMLGFRLRSIPRQSIVSYSIEPWAFIRGYGIRGIGKSRAYVWGNRVVHIKTLNGDIFLGHDDPQRIVSDLDRVMSR
jgi:hypothetical protein